MRTVVVGASTGLGRCLGAGLAGRGARVALLARRVEMLEDAARETGAGAVAIQCDVTERESCERAVAEAVEALGGIDAVVYCPGYGILSRIEDLQADDWRAAFDTNVVGASLFTAAALRHLVESSGTIAYLSTVSASATSPWPGLASYSVTKAALDKLIEAWRVEHPEVGFTRVVVGECAGGEGPSGSQFMSGWDMELFGEVLPVWLGRQLLSGRVFDQGELIHVIEAVLRCGASAAIPSVTIVPRQSAQAATLDEVSAGRAINDLS